ncbi:hypothetical protein [uncultured Alistipes sp.]|jgi:hypothetical protein|uniref:hypothetical protein n=1 Tax=uncultured Alistipes sp. TaxID=538949 RepID=UPI0025CD6527|nr:hypothetical protein [uncultured Alistipes sp.]
MDKTNQMHGESRDNRNDTQTGPMKNGNTNNLDPRSHGRDNSGMHAGGTEGSSYRQQQQPGHTEQYGSKKGSYWEEKGSDREQSIGSRMNEESMNKKQQDRQQYGQQGQNESRDTGDSTADGKEKESAYAGLPKQR